MSARCIGYADDAVWVTRNSPGSDKTIHQGAKCRISRCEVLRSMVEAEICFTQLYASRGRSAANSPTLVVDLD